VAINAGGGGGGRAVNGDCMMHSVLDPAQDLLDCSDANSTEPENSLRN
jgi:hypothetical protein